MSDEIQLAELDLSRSIAGRESIRLGGCYEKKSHLLAVTLAPCDLEVVEHHAHKSFICAELLKLELPLAA